MAIKQIKRYHKNQTVKVLLIFETDSDVYSVIYYITEEEWDLALADSKYPKYTLPPIVRGYTKYLDLPYKDMDALWDQGDIGFFHFDKIE